MAAVVTEQDNGMEVVAMSRELSTYEAMGGTYTEVDGVFYPNIVVSEEANVWIGKYGLLWIDYSNFALEKVPIHLENSIITGIKIA